MSQQPSHPESARRQQLTLLWMQAQPIVSAYINSAVRDQQHAEDLLQETALSIAESFEQYDTAKPFLPWAIGVAKNKLLHYYRRHRNDRLVFDDELLGKIGPRYEAESIAAMKEQGAALQLCIDKLAEHARAILEMRYVRDMGYEQIAEAVGRTAAGVANNLYRSRKALATCVKRQTRIEKGGSA